MKSVRKIFVGMFCCTLLCIASHASEKNLFQYDKQKIATTIQPIQHLENNLTAAGILSENYVSTPEIENSISDLNICSEQISTLSSLASSLDEDASLEGICCCIGLLVLGIWVVVKLLK